MSAAVKDLTTWLPQIFVFKAGAIPRRDLSRTTTGPVNPAGGPSPKVLTFAQTDDTDGPTLRDRTVGREDDRAEERKAQIIRALCRALFAHGDCGKRPGFPSDSTRDGGRMAQAGRRRSTPFATQANANEVI